MFSITTPPPPESERERKKIGLFNSKEMRYLNKIRNKKITEFYRQTRKKKAKLSSRFDFVHNFVATERNNIKNIFVSLFLGREEKLFPLIFFPFELQQYYFNYRRLKKRRSNSSSLTLQ